MNSFAYRVYYEHKEPSCSVSFSSYSESHEASEALRRFPDELPGYFSSQSANVSYVPTTHDRKAIIVEVVTSLSETATDDAVKQCLKKLDLHAVKLE